MIRPTFDLKDEHLNAIMNVSSKICRRLRFVRYKNNNLIKITNAGVEQLVTLCPKLEHIHFENAPMLSDKALSAIFRGCLFIRSVVIGGPDATPENVQINVKNDTRWMFQGAISGASLDELQQDKSLAVNLGLLDLRNQPFDIDERHASSGDSITAARRRLYVVHGYGGDHCLFYGGNRLIQISLKCSLTLRGIAITTMNTITTSSVSSPNCKLWVIAVWDWSITSR